MSRCASYDVRYEKNGCIRCTSNARTKDGYVQVSRDGKTVLLHRHVYESVHGPQPPEVVIRHTCDTPDCISLAHLIPGTHEDNVADRVARGRTAIGPQNGRAKLTVDDVRAIKRDTETGTTVLARHYGVDPKAIRQIRQGKTWRHVT